MIKAIDNCCICRAIATGLGVKNMDIEDHIRTDTEPIRIQAPISVDTSSFILLVSKPQLPRNLKRAKTRGFVNYRQVDALGF